MKFSLKGKIKGRDKERVLNFDNGKLTGDLPIIKELQHKALEIDIAYGRTISPYNYSPQTDEILEDGLAVVLLFHELCEDIKYKGDVPKLPELPEGAK